MRVNCGVIKANVDGRPLRAARNRYSQVLRASSPRQAVDIGFHSSGNGALGSVDTAQALLPPRQEEALDLVPAGRLQVTQPRCLTALDLREAPLCRQRGGAAGSEGFSQSRLCRRRQEEKRRSSGAAAPVKSKALQNQPEATVKVAFRQDHELHASEPVVRVVHLAELVEQVRVGLVLPVRFKCWPISRSHDSGAPDMTIVSLTTAHKWSTPTLSGTPEWFLNERTCRKQTCPGNVRRANAETET
jgi:hypothetical protein